MTTKDTEKAQRTQSFLLKSTLSHWYHFERPSTINVTIIIPNPCAVPVMAPKTSSFFMVGITSVVNIIAVAKPIPVNKPRVNPSKNESASVVLSKIEIATVVIK